MTHDWILFLTHAWDGIVSGPWLLSGQRRALFTAVQQSDRCWHCCLRSRLCLVATWLLEGHVGNSRGIIILRAGLNWGSQRTFGDHMMLWRWSLWPLCLWQWMGPPKPSIIRLTQQTFGPSISSFNKQQALKLFWSWCGFAKAVPRIIVYFITYFRNQGVLLWLPARLGKVCHQCFHAPLLPGTMMANLMCQLLKNKNCAGKL